MKTTENPTELTREQLAKVVGGARPPRDIIRSKDCAGCEHSPSSQEFPK